MSETSTTTNELGKVHAAFIRGFLEKGFCPTRREVSGSLGMSVANTDDALRDLDSIHGLVLHPTSPEPWVVHPFSLDSNSELHRAR